MKTIVLGFLGQLATELLELVAPPQCAGCEEPVAEHCSFCPACMSQLELAQSEDPGIFAAFVQDGPLKSATHRAKFGADASCARAMGKLLHSVLPSTLREVDVVLPVPLHHARLAERGFNQSVEIARALKLPILFDAVERQKSTKAQARLNREEREHNVAHAFVLKRPECLTGKRVLLLDDVTTTGATLRSLRDAILPANPQQIYCAAVGQAVLRMQRGQVPNQ